MLFERIRTKYLLNGKEQEHIRFRLEYALHYWTYLFSDNYHLDTTISKYESHRTLFNKIFFQIKYHGKQCKKTLNLVLFTKNSLFSDNNLLIRRIHSDKFRGAFTELKNDLLSTKNWDVERVTNNFKTLKKYILHNYSSRLSLSLYHIIKKNKPLTLQEARDIQFLINAFIAELLELGYDKDFVRFLITAVALKAHPMDQSFNVPFDKTELDFPDDGTSFRSYVKSQIEDLSLSKQIESLKNLLSARKHNIKAIFRVSNLQLNINQSINLWECELLKSNSLGFTKDSKVNTFLKNSNCLLVVNFQSPDFHSVPFSVTQKAKECISGINTLFHTNCSIDEDNIVLTTLTQDRYRMVTKYRSFWKQINIGDINFKAIEGYNSLRNGNDLHSGFRRIITLMAQFDRDTSSVSIAEFWTSIESLFAHQQTVEEKKIDLINLVKNCYKIFVKKHFNNINSQFLDIAFTQTIVLPYTKHEAPSIYFYNDFKKETANRKLFYETKIVPWCEYTINHVYAERNLEVHNNIKNDLSYQTVFWNFMRIINVVFQILWGHIKNESSLEKVITKIEMKATKLTL